MKAFRQEVYMSPKFFDELNLKNNSRTVAAGGPCNWDRDDDWAEIRQVTIRQGTIVGSCGAATKTVRNGTDRDWWLDATSSSPFARGSAQASAVAIVHRTDNTTYEVPWPDSVQLH
jgi:hypothetical protein